MGRRIVPDEEKKVKLGVSLDPDIPAFIKERSINLSALVNKLLREYINNGNKGLH
jgi:hypothetical protein